MIPKHWDITLPVDLIRAVAIVLVILLHASIEDYPNVDLMSPQGTQIWVASNIYDSIARVCIPLFVMLAGALLLQPSKADEPLGVFFKKRFARIGVPFLFWGAIYFVWGYFVEGWSLSAQTIAQGILNGPYYQFWFLYLLLGLYILTPILRVLIKHAKPKIIRYLVAIWFLGTAILPLIGLLGPYQLNANVFIFTGWIGYFVLGVYLLNVHVRRWLLYVGLAGGLLWTMIGTYLIVGHMGEKYSQYFYDAYTFNIIVASEALFLLLLSVPTQALQNQRPRLNRAVKVVSANTLPIFLFHPIVLETLQNGYLGVTISITTLNPFIEIPLITALTLLICLAVIVPLKKIPGVKRVIG